MIKNKPSTLVYIDAGSFGFNIPCFMNNLEAKLLLEKKVELLFLGVNYFTFITKFEYEGIVKAWIIVPQVSYYLK